MPARNQVTPLALAVLELLHEHPMHPYEMRQTMRQRHTHRLVKLNAGSLYHTVERLERLELIEVSETGREGRRPERTVYAITQKGHDVFAAHVTDMIAIPADEYPEFPLAIALAHAIDGSAVRGELDRRRADLQATVDSLERAREHLEDIALPRRFWVEVDYLATVRRAEIAWITGLIDELDSGQIDWPATDFADSSRLHIAKGGAPE